MVTTTYLEEYYGRTGAAPQGDDGEETAYHYHLNEEFLDTRGCYRGRRATAATRRRRLLTFTSTLNLSNRGRWCRAAPALIPICSASRALVGRFAKAIHETQHALLTLSH